MFFVRLFSVRSFHVHVDVKRIWCEMTIHRLASTILKSHSLFCLPSRLWALRSWLSAESSNVKSKKGQFSSIKTKTHKNIIAYVWVGGNRDRESWEGVFLLNRLCSPLPFVLFESCFSRSFHTEKLKSTAGKVQIECRELVEERRESFFCLECVGIFNMKKELWCGFWVLWMCVQQDVFEIGFWDFSILLALFLTLLPWNFVKSLFLRLFSARVFAEICIFWCV